jgi:hypothetical protein
VVKKEKSPLSKDPDGCAPESFLTTVPFRWKRTTAAMATNLSPSSSGTTRPELVTRASLPRSQRPARRAPAVTGPIIER